MFGFFSQPQFSALLICTANICRSPAAEGLLRARLNRRGIKRSIRINSAGTSQAPGGQPPDPRMVSLGKQSGVSLKRLRSKPVDSVLISEASVVWCMESEHLNYLRANYPEYEDKFELFDPQGADIPDPFFGSMAGVREAFDRIEQISEFRAGEIAASI